MLAAWARSASVTVVGKSDVIWIVSFPRPPLIKAAAESAASEAKLNVSSPGVPSYSPVLIVAVTADVVVVLPAVSVALAVKLWLPSRSAGVA